MEKSTGSSAKRLSSELCSIDYACNKAANILFENLVDQILHKI